MLPHLTLRCASFSVLHECAPVLFFIVACISCNNPKCSVLWLYMSTQYFPIVSECIPIPACRLFIWQGNNSMIDCLGRSRGKTHTSKAPLCTQSNGRLLGSTLLCKKLGHRFNQGSSGTYHVIWLAFELGIHVIWNLFNVGWKSNCFFTAKRLWQIVQWHIRGF